MSIPAWLQHLRRELIVAPVQARSAPGTLLGVPIRRVMDALGGGKTDFTLPWERLTVDDLALLYGYFLQKGHVNELLKAFRQLIAKTGLTNPVVVDLGCGPFTGGLAFAAVHGNSFSYIGLDRAEGMIRLGQRLATRASELSGISADVQWTTSLAAIRWQEPPRWRPVIVIASYLLASASVEPTSLVSDLNELTERFGRGPVTVLYTNAVGEEKNRKFPAFRAALEALGFALIDDSIGYAEDETRTRPLRYALFHRQAMTKLELGPR